MGFRYRKSIKAGPMRINLSKSGVGFSAGVNGFRVAKKASGGIRTTTSIPGTGISYAKEYGSAKRSKTAEDNTHRTDSDPSGVTDIDRPSESTNYCKHCYRMMDDGADICPACGKSQKDKVITNTMRVWIGVGVWFVCMAIFALIGTVLKVSSLFFNIIAWCTSILFAVLIARSGKPAQNGV